MKTKISKLTVFIGLFGFFLAFSNSMNAKEKKKAKKRRLFF